MDEHGRELDRAARRVREIERRHHRLRGHPELGRRPAPHAAPRTLAALRPVPRVPDRVARLEAVDRVAARAALELTGRIELLAPADDRLGGDEREIAGAPGGVAHVQPGQHEVVGRGIALRVIARAAEHVGAERLELAGLERRTGARIAAGRRPGVLGDDRGGMTRDRGVVQRDVERAELPGDHRAHVEVGRDRDVVDAGGLVALVRREHEHREILRAAIEPERQHEPVGVVGDAQRRQRGAVEPGRIEPRDHQGRPGVGVGAEQRLGAGRQREVAGAQVALERAGVLGRHDREVVRTCREVRHGLARVLGRLELDRRIGLDRRGRRRRRARILLPGLDQARRGELIDVRHDLARHDLDVAVAHLAGHRDDQRDRLGRPAVRWLDRQHRAGAEPHHHDLGRVAAGRRIAAGHEQAAERDEREHGPSLRRTAVALRDPRDLLAQIVTLGLDHRQRRVARGLRGGDQARRLARQHGAEIGIGRGTAR